MSRFLHYDKNDTYLENMNYAKAQRQKRFNEEREEIERDKLELDKIQNQIDMENQLEKQKKALLKQQQYEEYTNYLKQRQSELPEQRNKLNIKLGGEQRVIQKPNYNQQLDNLCLNPTKQANIQPQGQFINFSNAGRNYQRGYSHGYNILTGEIFSSPNSSNVSMNRELPQTYQTDVFQKEYENENNNINIKKDENMINAQNNIINKKEKEENDYLSYMEILRKKEIEQNNNTNINNQQYKKDYIDIPPEYREELMNNYKTELQNKSPQSQYEELMNQQNINISQNQNQNQDQKPKPSYHNIPSSSSSSNQPKSEIKEEDLLQMNRPISQNIEKRPYHILDSSKNEYLYNKQKNMISNYDIFKGKEYYQTQYKQNDDTINPKYGKLEKQREYAKVLEGQINSKRIYEETIKNLCKNTEPEIERFRNNNNMMIFGGMNPYQSIKDRNNKLNDIPQDPYSNKKYNINSESYLSSNPITNPSNSYQYNNGRKRFSGRLQNNGNNIIGTQ